MQYKVNAGHSQVAVVRPSNNNAITTKLHPNYNETTTKLRRSFVANYMQLTTRTCDHAQKHDQTMYRTIGRQEQTVEKHIPDRVELVGEITLL